MRLFPVPARVRGVSYFHGGRVRDVQRGVDAIRGTVQGTQAYALELTRSARKWRLSCTCPAAEGGQLCKHGYAFLSELQQHGGVGEIAVHAKAVDPHPAQLLTGLPPQRAVSSDSLLDALRDVRFARPPGESKVRLMYVLSAGEPGSKLAEIEILVAKKRANWRAVEYQPMWAAPPQSELDLLDRRALALIHGALHALEAPRGPRPLGPELQSALLVELAQNGRLGFAASRRRGVKLLELDEAGSWSFEVGLERVDDELELDAWLTRHGERIALANVDLALQADLAVAREQLRRVDWHGAFELAMALAGRCPSRFPADAQAKLTALFASCPPSLPLHADEFVEVLGGAATPVLELLSTRESRGYLPIALQFEYAGKRVGRTSEDAAPQDARLLRVVRDLERERAAVSELASVGGELYAAPRRGIDGVVPLSNLGGLVRDLTLLGWKVEGQGKRIASGGVARARLSSGQDWFGLRASLDFDGASADTPALLEAIANKSKLVRLSDGGLGVLPETWLEQWGLLLRAGEAQDGDVRFSKGRAFLLDALLADNPAVDTDAGFERWREALAAARLHTSLVEPAAFVGELRGYQREGLGWLEFLSSAALGGCLADDMGLGKTVQVLALALARKPRARGPSLVVAPKTLLFNWESEGRRFAPSLSVLVHHGNARARTKQPLEAVDIVVTTYGTLRLDIEMLRGIEFDLAVLDEAQAIKNPASQSAKATRLIKARMRLALTGTPVENRLGDLLSIFEFLNPGLVEGSRALRSLGAEDDLAAARLAARALRPFLLRRTKEEVLRDLPPKTEQTLLVELEGAQLKEYAKLREHYRRVLLATVDEIGLDKARMNVLEALLRLRQAACHVGLIDTARVGEPCAKIETLLPLLEEVLAAGHKALVFSQFTSFLAIVRAKLDERGMRYEYLDGRTRDRSAKVTNFQENPEIGLFLVSLKAGGTGLNLTAADYVFLLDPWWNPAVERQAVDRAHRIGQTRAVTAYRLVARETVEEKVLALQERKKELADALFGGEGRGLRELTREDLEWVLS